MVAPLLVEYVRTWSPETGHWHHTKRFECVHGDWPTAVLRRGQPFPVTVAFANRPYHRERDEVILTFSFGKAPNMRRGTLFQLVVSPRGVGSRGRPGALQWGVAMDTYSDYELILQVEAAADCLVGRWTLDVETRLLGDEKKRVGRYSYPHDIYILFNPWSKKDQVYMEDERLLDEYVLSNVGKVCNSRGKFGEFLQSRYWVFGQFDRCVLPAAQLALSRSTLRIARRGDPVQVARAISQVVNSANGNGGILVGKWDFPYDDGTEPLDWTGSVAILDDYLKTGAPVKYAQCWVFAAVATTVCRALGIPARLVTNMRSGGDYNGSLTIDFYLDAEGRDLEWDPNSGGDAEKIWNYHAWTEVWMARPNLPKRFDGWQAIDACPQETSDGLFQCGPAPLEAIRNGDVGFYYDVRSMLAKVNADVFYWMEDPNSEMGFSKIRSEKRSTGLLIVTKKPGIFDPRGDRDQEDITDQYKYKEGTEEERMALKKAVSQLELASRFYEEPEEPLEDVHFSLVDLDEVPIGHDFSVRLIIHNRASGLRTVRARLSALSVFYTGAKAGVIKEDTRVLTLPPDANESLVMSVAADEYLDKLVELWHVMTTAFVTVLETNYKWLGEDVFALTRPPLVIEVEAGSVAVGREVTIAFSLKNPLGSWLTGCKLRIESPELVRPTVVNCRDVGPYEELMVRKYFTPTTPGEHRLVGTFSCNELVRTTGAVVFDVFD